MLLRIRPRCRSSSTQSPSHRLCRTTSWDTGAAIAGWRSRSAARGQSAYAGDASSLLSRYSWLEAGGRNSSAVHFNSFGRCLGVMDGSRVGLPRSAAAWTLRSSQAIWSRAAWETATNSGFKEVLVLHHLVLHACLHAPPAGGRETACLRSSRMPFFQLLASTSSSPAKHSLRRGLTPPGRDGQFPRPGSEEPAGVTFPSHLATSSGRSHSARPLHSGRGRREVSSGWAGGAGRTDRPLAGPAAPPHAAAGSASPSLGRSRRSHGAVSV